MSVILRDEMRYDYIYIVRSNGGHKSTHSSEMY
jgi:hypothetical protein